MTVKEQAVSCRLGQQVFEAYRSAYGTPTTDDWFALPATEKRRYVQIAQSVLLDMRPAPSPYFDLAADLARARASNVIGRITPEAPYGEPA